MAIVDWLFPKLCIGCGEVGAYICPLCLNKLLVIANPICPLCLRGSLWGRTHRWCRTKSSLDGLVSVMAYKGLVEKIVKTYKYRYVQTLTTDLVELMISMGDWSAIEGKAWVVVAVPLHPQRERWRGFNQAVELAKGLAKYGHWRYEENILVRQRATPAQMSLGRAERQVNLVGAFESGLKIQAVRGRQVLLVDDVWTTGATLRECAKVLKQHGASEVWGVTLARAV